MGEFFFYFLDEYLLRDTGCYHHRNALLLTARVGHSATFDILSFFLVSGFKKCTVSKFLSPRY